MDYTGNLEGRVALVTGGSSGIGRAAACAFARRGARVVVAARHGEEVVDGIAASGGEALFCRADVSVERDARRMVAAALDAYGRLDFALNSAGADTSSGASASSAVTDFLESDWDHLMDVNLKGVWLSMKYELRPMLAAGAGVVVNVSSVAGLVGIRNSSAYCASKHGVVGLTKAAALEVAARGVRVNAVCPGATRTPMLEHLLTAQPERRGAYEAAIPLGRLAEPEEVAETAVFLCTDAAAYVTGAIVPVEGGWSAG